MRTGGQTEASQGRGVVRLGGHCRAALCRRQDSRQSQSPVSAHLAPGALTHAAIGGLAVGHLASLSRGVRRVSGGEGSREANKPLLVAPAVLVPPGPSRPASSARTVTVAAGESKRDTHLHLQLASGRLLAGSLGASRRQGAAPGRKAVPGGRAARHRRVREEHGARVRRRHVRPACSRRLPSHSCRESSSAGWRRRHHGRRPGRSMSAGWRGRAKQRRLSEAPCGV
jgi:hypothetical protein